MDCFPHHKVDLELRLILSDCYYQGQERTYLLKIIIIIISSRIGSCSSRYNSRSNSSKLVHIIFFRFSCNSSSIRSVSSGATATLLLIVVAVTKYVTESIWGHFGKYTYPQLDERIDTVLMSVHL